MHTLLPLRATAAGRCTRIHDYGRVSTPGWRRGLRHRSSRIEDGFGRGGISRRGGVYRVGVALKKVVKRLTTPVEELDRQIEQLAELPTLKPMVAVLQCFRGISLHSAMVLATELVDWRRFERPGQLACYLGLISREDSSGNRQRLGSITKAGNSHCRHVLVQAAWSYRHRPQTSVDLKRRQQGNRPR